jgi:hypothetical protein
VWPISLCWPRPSARQIFGSWVVLPEPVSPLTITTALSRIARAISSRRALTGSSSGKVIGGSGFEGRAARGGGMDDMESVGVGRPDGNRWPLRPPHGIAHWRRRDAGGAAKYRQPPPPILPSQTQSTRSL